VSEEKTLVGEKEFEGMSGIFIAEYDMANMKMERIVVSNPAILAILKVVKLPEAAQEKAVYDLVDRTPEWNKLDTEVQVAKIKAILTQESVIEFLKAKEVIRPKCDVVQTGIDIEGSIVIEAYYVSLNREQRRLIDKTHSEAEKQRLAEAVNIMGSNDNLIDMAKARMEKLAKEGKVVKPREQRRKVDKEWRKNPWK
jgi:hypothetical protein